MPKESQLATSNMVDKRLGVGHGINHGVCNMIFSFYVEHNPVAGGREGIDFTFHVNSNIELSKRQYSSALSVSGGFLS